MNSNRIWVLGSVIVIIGLLAATWFLGVSPQLSLAALAASDRETVETANTAQEANLARLKADFEGIDDLKSELEAAQMVVPGDKGQKELIAEIGEYAKSNGVLLAGIEFANPNPYTPGNNTDPEVLQAMGAVNSSNFLSIPMAIGVAGDYSDVMAFIDDVQHGTRLVLVRSLSIDEGSAKSSSAVTMAIGAETFVLLGAADVPAPPVEETPATGAEDPATTTAE